MPTNHSLPRRSPPAPVLTPHCSWHEEMGHQSRSIQAIHRDAVLETEPLQKYIGWWRNRPPCPISPPPPRDEHGSSSSSRSPPRPTSVHFLSYTCIHIGTCHSEAVLHTAAIILCVWFCNLLFSLPNPTCYLYLLCFPKDLRRFTGVPEGGVQSGERARALECRWPELIPQLCHPHLGRLGPVPKFSGPQYASLWNGENDSIYLPGSVWLCSGTTN